MKQSLEAAQKNLRRAKYKLVAGDTAVRRAKVELTSEQIILKRFADQLAAVTSSAVGCITGYKRDCFRLAAKLTREHSVQETKIQHLNDDLRVKQTIRDGFKREVADRQREHDRVIGDLKKNGCI